MRYRAHGRGATTVGHRVLVAGCVLLACGCTGRRSREARADSAFVATVAELRRVDRNASLDSAGRANERGRVLQRRGLTAAELEARSRAMATDPARATRVWDAVNRASGLASQ